MYFNPKVKFTQLTFRREKREGRYISEPEPLGINYDKIDMFGDGVLKLDNGESIYVEQDYDQINAILEAKIKEAETYQAALKEADRTGLPPTEAEPMEDE